MSEGLHQPGHRCPLWSHFKPSIRVLYHYETHLAQLCWISRPLRLMMVFPPDTAKDVSLHQNLLLYLLVQKRSLQALKKPQDANAEASNQWVHHASCSHLWSTVYSYSVYKSTITRRKRCSCSGMTVSHDNPTLVSHPQVIPSSYLVFEARASKSRVTSHLCNSGDVHLLFTVCGFLRSRKVWRFIVCTQMFLHKSLQVAWSR